MRLFVLFALACMCLCLTGPVSAADTILLARGDSLVHSVSAVPADLWVFSTSGLSHLYDIPAVLDSEGVYCLNLTPDQSSSLEPGKYSIIVQTPGEDTYNVVDYVSRVNVSGASLSYLVSPFRNINDIPLDGLQPNQVRDKLLDMIGASDDKYLELLLEVQQPHTYINTIEQWNETAVHVSGVTNLQDGTRVAIIWDEDKLVSAQDFRLNTFYTYASAARDSDIRLWSTNISVNMDEVSDGKHWVAVEAGGLVTRVAINAGISFNQSEIKMEPIKYLWNGVVVTPTPIIIEKPIYIDRTVIQTVITIITTQPFPKNALGEEYNPSEVPDVSIVLIPACACLLAVAVLRKGQGGWKKEPKHLKVVLKDTGMVDAVINPPVKVPERKIRSLMAGVLTRKRDTLPPKPKKVPISMRVKAWIDKTFWITVPAKVPEPVPEKGELYDQIKDEDLYYGQL